MTEKQRNQMDSTFEWFNDLNERFWDLMLVGLGSLSWTQEQIEAMSQRYIEQRKLNREEGAKVAEGLFLQMKNNQIQLQKMMQESINIAMQNMDNPIYRYFEDLNKKVEDLEQKVDEL